MYCRKRRERIDWFEVYLKVETTEIDNCIVPVPVLGGNVNHLTWPALYQMCASPYATWI
jgi:hypothetical protein